MNNSETMNEQMNAFASEDKQQDPPSPEMAKIRRLCDEIAEILEDSNRENAVLQSYICARSYAGGNETRNEFVNSFLPWLEEVVEDEGYSEEEMHVEELKWLADRVTWRPFRLPGFDN